MFSIYPSPDHLHIWPSLSLRRSALLRRRYRHRLRILFAIASHPLVRFIVVQLLYPCRHDWLSCDATFISTICHHWLIFSSFPSLDLVILIRHCLRSCLRRCIRCQRSTPLFLCSPLPSPPSPPSDSNGPHFFIDSFRRLLSPVAIAG